MSHASPLPLPTLAEIDARLDALEHERAELRDLRKVVARREGRAAPPVAEMPGTIADGPEPGLAGIITKDEAIPDPRKTSGYDGTGRHAKNTEAKA